jgi:lipid-A-disaccharide synthase
VTGLLIYVIAGEPSGDFLGARLMAALKERTQGSVRFAGIGGEEMAAQGLQSRVPLDELAVMGVAEVLPRARRIFRHVAATVEDVVRLRPDAVVTIDSSGFTWRVAQRLRRRGERVPLIHYVAPMVWAWRAGRARRMARWYDHLMVLLPFEPPYFTAVGLSCAYVGHPVIESGADRGDGPAFRQRHDIAAAAPLVILLPGSRRGEARRLLPVFKDAVSVLAARHPGLRVALPTTATVRALAGAMVADWPVPVILVERGEKYDAFAAGTVALAASGTVALELALAQLPAVIAYRINRLTHALVKRVVKIRYSHLLNLVLGREAVPELLQDNCTPARLAEEAARLIDDPAARARQLAACREGLEALGLGALSPGLRAADQVLAIIAARATRPDLDR